MRNISIIARFFLSSAFCILVCLGSINGWSLWTDESSTAFFAGQPSLESFVAALSTWTGSEAQMPGFIFGEFLWDKLFGASEISLRLFNVVPTILMLIYLYSLICRDDFDKELKQKVMIFTLVAFVSPFIIYNLNEARVNHSLFALGTISIGSIFAYVKYKRLVDLYVCFLSLVIGFAFNMLYFMVGIPIILIILFCDKSFFRESWKHLIAPVVLLGAIGVYYLGTLMHGSGGMVEKPGIINIAYSLYEFCGFGGLGIPKNELRGDRPILAKVNEYITPMSIGVLAYISLLIAAIKCRWYSKVALMLFVSFVGFVVIAYFANFRFWGRHMMMLYPLFVFALGDLLYKTWSELKFGRVIVVFFIGVMSYGSYRIVTNDCYKKDDVKSAIAYTNEVNKGERVYYMGFPKLADYYKLNNYLDCCNTEDNMQYDSKGLLLYHKSMNVFYNTLYKGINPLKEQDKFTLTLVWEDQWSELYRFEPIAR